MTAYYNEFDPKAAAWLRQLILNGDIAPGVVDERSIIDVKSADLAGYTQHHFFAGIGVWSYALRNAGWSDDTPVCTASLPCQPFSAAGNQKGKEDERHLLPHFLELVKECGFNTIFGEQVESAIRHGWLDDLQTVMERESYAVGRCVLGAHSINAPHQRQRLFWVATRGLPDPEVYGGGRRLRQIPSENEVKQTREKSRQNEAEQPINGGTDNGVADSTSKRQAGERRQGQEGITEHCQDSRMGNTESERPQRVRSESGKPQGQARRHGDGESNSGMGNTKRDGLDADKVGRSPSESEPERPSADEIEWLYCRDNKYRPIKSGLKPLVDGVARGVVYRGGAINPNNTGFARAIRVKGYGNAINADVACEFITAYMEVNELIQTYAPRGL